MIENEIIRYCPVCKEDLPKESYRPSEWKKGPGNPCKKCANIRANEFRKTHSESIRIRENGYYHKKSINEKRSEWLKYNYGLTLEDVDKMFSRQLGKCLGCQLPLPTGFGKGKRFHVDHNHKTGKVRGLLCGHCNSILGLSRENKETLRRLTSYLDYDRLKLHVYIIGSLRNPLVPEVASKLREQGFEAMDEWFSAGPEADDWWQKYETNRGRSYVEALQSKSAKNVYLFDRSLLDLADIGVLVMPGGRSCHLELGYLAGCGKPTYILNAGEPERFDVMPQFTNGVFNTIEELIKELSTKSI